MPAPIKQPILSLAINQLSDTTDISAMWNLLTKCKNSLENGHRLENMSWRLWYRSSHSNKHDLNPLVEVGMTDSVYGKSFVVKDRPIVQSLPTEHTAMQMIPKQQSYTEQCLSTPAEVTLPQINRPKSKEVQQSRPPKQPRHHRPAPAQGSQQRNLLSSKQSQKVFLPSSPLEDMQREDAVAFKPIQKPRATFYVDSPSEGSDFSDYDSDVSDTVVDTAPTFNKTMILKWQNSRRSLLSFGIRNDVEQHQTRPEPAEQQLSESLRKQLRFEHQALKPKMSLQSAPESWPLSMGLW